MSYVLPGLAAWVWPALRAPLGVEDRTSSGTGYALTFDDGPHPQGTPAVLEILRARARARDVLPGRRAGPAKPLAGAGDRRGRPRIGLHCDRHRNLLRLTPRQVRADIARAQETIEQASGRAIDLYRPPYGVLNASALRIARAHGWRTLLWSHAARTGRSAPRPLDRHAGDRGRRGGLCAAPARRRRLLPPAPGGARRRLCRGSSRRLPGGVCRRLRPDRPIRSRLVKRTIDRRPRRRRTSRRARPHAAGAPRPRQTGRAGGASCS